MNYLRITIKYIVVLFNFLCVVLGIVIVFLSALLMKELGEAIKPFCVNLIVFGSIILCIAFVGCCGALIESLFCIWTYATCLLVLIVCNAINIIYINKADSVEHARHDVNLAWQHMKEGSDVTMHMFQSVLECCGKLDYNDYTNEDMLIPISCYRGYTMMPEDVYQTGCLAELTDSYNTVYKHMSIGCLTIFTIQALSLAFAVALGIIYQLDD